MQQIKQEPNFSKTRVVKVVSHQKPRNLAYIKRDRGYRWTDRDPVLDDITRLITDSGLSIGDKWTWLLDSSRTFSIMSYATIANWMSGKTRRPQNFTITWVAQALGYNREFVKRFLPKGIR